jgi:Helix-turn-helix domain of alkylmercury lyase
MQHTRLQAIAQAVCKRQERYQRNTLLFDQLVRLLVRGQPVAPELLAHLLHWELEEVRSILQAHPELEYNAQATWSAPGSPWSQPRTSFEWSSASCLPGVLSIP